MISLNQARNIFSLQEKGQYQFQVGLIKQSIDNAVEKALDRGSRVCLAVIPLSVESDLVAAVRHTLLKQGFACRFDNKYIGTKHWRRTLTIWL